MKSSAARFLSHSLRLSALAGLLLLPSCGKKEDYQKGADQTPGNSGSTPPPAAGAEPPAPEQNPKKSGPREGKPSSAASMIKTASGLQYEVLKEGIGDKPGPNDRVTVHYHGTLEDGTVFDSSVERKEPATFPVSGVIKGWVEGLQLMSEGSKYRFVIPPDLAYGERGAGGKIGPNQTLIFEVELISIEPSAP